jgi:putative lipoic acid-binding regulatory protein
VSDEAPTIEFPCRYPIKVLGRAGEDFEALVSGVVERHAAGFDRSLTQRRNSRGGTFLSLTFIIEATGKEQLAALHQDLMATGRVSMVI